VSVGASGGLRIAVVGATGAVGTIMLDVLEERRLPVAEVVPFASARSAGRELRGMEVRALEEGAIEGFDLALFSAGAGVSREWAPRFAAAGAVVVDNSSAWRTDPGIPLVVAEVNPEALDAHCGIVANPNCSTMQLLVAIKPIHDAVGIERLLVSTYQSVSGTGVKAVEELKAQTHAVLHDMAPAPPEVYPHQIAFNVLGGAGTFAEGEDHTNEERKMIFETRKILADETIRVGALLARAPGVAVVDDPTRDSYPTALDAAGRDEVLVGRIRRDPSHERALQLWVVSDNLRKGAATNAVQLAELLHSRGLLGARAARAA